MGSQSFSVSFLSLTMSKFTYYSRWFSKEFMRWNADKFTVLKEELLPSQWSQHEKKPRCLAGANNTGIIRSELETAAKTKGPNSYRDIVDNGAIIFCVNWPQTVPRAQFEWFCENALKSNYNYDFDERHKIHSITIKPPSNGKAFNVCPQLKSVLEAAIIKPKGYIVSYYTRFERDVLSGNDSALEYIQSFQFLREFSANYQYLNKQERVSSTRRARDLLKKFIPQKNVEGTDGEKKKKKKKKNKRKKRSFQKTRTGSKFNTESTTNHNVYAQERQQNRQKYRSQF